MKKHIKKIVIIVVANGFVIGKAEEINAFLDQIGYK